MAGRPATEQQRASIDVGDDRVKIQERDYRSIAEQRKYQIRVMSYPDGRAQLPSQGQPYPPVPPGHPNGYARHTGPAITEPPANESTSQWPLGNPAPGNQGRKANNTVIGSARQQFAFPTPPNQRPTGAPNVQHTPAARDYEPTPPQSTAASRVASSRASTVSSVGTIPDFPLPQMPIPQMPIPAVAPQRKSQTFGPPPSARRPGPAYLTRDSFVTPIAEESPEASPRSVAFPGAAVSNHSSRLGVGVPSRNPFFVEKGESDVQHITTRDDATRLIQLAGRDQKSKPELVVTSPPHGLGVQQASGFRFPFASPTRSHASSEYELEFERPPLVSYGSRSRSPLLSPDDGMPSPLSERHFEARPSMSDKIPSNQRPPRLDLDTVRETEARGSLTSLPDLIRRATRLAANLDRGKTASRLGMLDLFTSGEKLNREKTDAQSISGSMSDMLSAFPAPGTTPTLTRGPSDFTTLNEDGASQPKRPGRRCCGMSLWVFVVVCLILLLLIAAAVLVPLFLIVLPNQRQGQRKAATQAALSDCSASFPCSNGGVSLISSNICSCICVDGFTGAQCTTGEDPGCITSAVTAGSKSVSNATVGSSIPRLFSGSQGNFSIPLNSTSLLSLFSANNLSCTSENALVTFNSQSSKLKRFYIVSEEEPVSGKMGSHVPAPTARAKLAEPLKDRRDSETVATSAGIVFQQSSTTAGAASQTVASIPSSTPSGAANGLSSAQSHDTLDFARVAVLYVLEQTTDLDAAIKVQQSIQDLFLGSSTNSTLALNFSGLNVTADFDSFALNFGNGTVLGGKGNGKGGLTGTGKRKGKRGRGGMM